MKPAPFAYARPETVADAVALLAEGGGEARILAGGQSLMPMLNFRLAQPAVLVDINRLSDVPALEEAADALLVGPTVRHADLLRHAAGSRHSLLAAAMPLIAHAGVRNRGTVCGSLALADPASELPACAVALDAGFQLASPRGLRTVAADAFFRGIYDTALAEDEMIVVVRFPAPAPGWRWTCREVARRHGDFAIAGLAAGARVENGRARDLRLVAFGIGERPARLGGAEAILAAGGDLAEAVAALEEVEVIGSADYPAPYRRHLLATLLARALADLAPGDVP